MNNLGFIYIPTDAAAGGGGGGTGSIVVLEAVENYTGVTTYQITTPGKTTANIVAVFVNEQVMFGSGTGDYMISSPTTITFAFSVKGTNLQIILN